MMSKHCVALESCGLTTLAPIHLLRLDHFLSRQLCHVSCLIACFLESLFNFFLSDSPLRCNNAFSALVMTAKVFGFFPKSPINDWIVWVWPQLPSILLTHLYNPQFQSQLPPTQRSHKSVLCGNTFIFISPYLAASGFVLSSLYLNN